MPTKLMSTSLPRYEILPYEKLPQFSSLYLLTLNSKPNVLLHCFIDYVCPSVDRADLQI